jgi:hypothetical protein
MNAGDPTSLDSAGPGFEFIQTDMTSLYNRPSFWTPANAMLDIQHASRSILHLNNDFVVVYDRATSLHAGLFKRFNLNFITTPTIDSTNRLVTETTPNGQKLFVRSLLPANVTIRWLVAGSGVYPVAETEPTIGRVVIEDTNCPTNIRFLHVLQAADAGASAMPATLVQSYSGNAFDGAQVGNALVLFANDLKAAFTGTSYCAPLTATTHYVSGLKPNASYDIAQQADIYGNWQITITPGTAFPADSAGLLAFTP